jgi:NDP-sugar pyrophosphorylase family protein
MYPIAILAGGLATRLRPLTETVPKALLEVNGEPFLAHQLRLLAANGLRRVVLCTGHLGERLAAFAGNGARFGLEVSCSPDGERLLGTAGCVRRALPLLGDRFFVMYGDSYLPCDMQAVGRAFDASGRLALMTVFRNDDQWDRSNVLFRDGVLLNYDKHRPDAAMRHIDYGLGVFHRRAFAGVPDGEPADLAGVYRALLARGEVAGYEVAERFYEIGSFNGLDALCRYLKSAAPRLTA